MWEPIQKIPRRVISFRSELAKSINVKCVQAGIRYNPPAAAQLKRADQPSFLQLQSAARTVVAAAEVQLTGERPQSQLENAQL